MAEHSLVDLVDPTISTHGMGNCLIGPYLPNSLVRLGPDTLRPQPTSGYNHQRPIVRFSHTHVSGTGGTSRFGNIGLFPFVGLPRLSMDPGEIADERAAVGHYHVRLNPSGVEVDLTSTPRTGVHRYRFPEGSLANVLVDAGSVVQRDFRRPVEETGGSVGGFVEVISDREVVGRGDYRGGWGHAFPYSVYFYARFDTPFVQKLTGNGQGLTTQPWATGPNAAAVLHFAGAREVGVKVGISFVSIAQARASVDRQADATFEQLVERSRQSWADTLGRIEVEGGWGSRKLFYTYFTRLMCMPTDLGVDDEFPLWHSGVRHFSEYYCLWDSVRNANSLISLFDPALERDMLNCLLDVAEHTGWLPDAWITGHSSQVQGGSSADILFCEARLKGIEGIDYERALAAMIKNATIPSDNPAQYGRYLEDYRDKGYLTTKVRKNCVSRHLEYAYQDWCTGRLASLLGDQETASKMVRQAENLWNLWHDGHQCFAPKGPDGRWVEPFDPASHLPDSWNDPYFYEGHSRQWSWNAHQDFAGLMRRMGGPEGFIGQLDAFFDAGHYLAKEIMLHIPYLYHYAGRPDRSAERVSWALDKFYTEERRGLMDNEDMGCQSAFLMASMMGIYPVMGQDLYWLTTPRFERSVVQLGDDPTRRMEIFCPGCDRSRPYIVEAKLDGRPLDRAWLQHHEIAEGATLELTTAAKPGLWGRHNPPPSPMAVA